MENVIRNTKFDNLVNYETWLLSNSSLRFVDFQSSADPTALSSIMKDNQLIEYSVQLQQAEIIIEIK